jgi:hypothetical protein
MRLLAFCLLLSAACAQAQQCTASYQGTDASGVAVWSVTCIIAIDPKATAPLPAPALTAPGVPALPVAPKVIAVPPVMFQPASGAAPYPQLPK